MNFSIKLGLVKYNNIFRKKWCLQARDIRKGAEGALRPVGIIGIKSIHSFNQLPPILHYLLFNKSEMTH